MRTKNGGRVRGYSRLGLALLCALGASVTAQAFTSQTWPVANTWGSGS